MAKKEEGERIQVGPHRVFVPYGSRRWTNVTPTLRVYILGNGDRLVYQATCDRCDVWWPLPQTIGVARYLNRGDQQVVCVPCQSEPFVPAFVQIHDEIVAELEKLDAAIAQVLGLEPEPGLHRRLYHERRVRLSNWPPAAMETVEVDFLAIPSPHHAQALARALGTEWGSRLGSLEVYYAVMLPEYELPHDPNHVLDHEELQQVPGVTASLVRAHEMVDKFLRDATRPEPHNKAEPSD